MTNGDRIVANKDLLNQEADDSLAFRDTKRFGGATQASQEYCEGFCQAQERGAALLCFPATRDPPGFRSLPKRLAIILPWPHSESFRFPQKKRSLAWGAGTTCSMVPRGKAGRKRRRKCMYLYVKWNSFGLGSLRQRFSH